MSTVHVIDGYPGAVYEHEPLAVDEGGHVLIEIPGIDRPRWTHPSNVFTSKAEAIAELRRRIGERFPDAQSHVMSSGPR